MTLGQTGTVRQSAPSLGERRETRKREGGREEGGSEGGSDLWTRYPNTAVTALPGHLDWALPAVRVQYAKMRKSKMLSETRKEVFATNWNHAGRHAYPAHPGRGALRGGVQPRGFRGRRTGAGASHCRARERLAPPPRQALPSRLATCEGGGRRREAGAPCETRRDRRRGALGGFAMCVWSAGRRRRAGSQQALQPAHLLRLQGASRTLPAP